LGFWAALGKHSPTPASNAAGVIQQPTCSTAFSSQFRQKPITNLISIYAKYDAYSQQFQRFDRLDKGSNSIDDRFNK
jgi:hypothetical protein